MNSKDKYSVVHFFGIILSIVFEFLGVLFLFGVIGYYIQTQFFQDNFIVLILSLFFGMMTGIYFMYNRAKKLSNIKVKEEKTQFKNIFTSKEKETQDRIQKVQKEIQDYENFLDNKLKRKKRK